MEGIYAAYYTGSESSGHALLIFKDGNIVGADVAGATYDGNYNVLENGEIKGSILLTVPPGGILVTGAMAGNEPMSFDIPFKLPSTFANGNTISLKTPTGPVNAIFKLIRKLS